MKFIKSIFGYSSLLLTAFLTNSCEDGKEEKTSPQESASVILMIGDGMGIAQISSSFYFSDSTSNFERFNSIGFIKTSSTSHTITDSAAGATAFSTGEKTYKRAIGVSKDTVALPTILENLNERGFGTGLISLTSITHATPASFYAHVMDRDMHEEIALDLLDSKVDFFAGGGLKYFTIREDGRNLYKELESRNYKLDSVKLSGYDTNRKAGFLLASEGIPSKIEGRGSYLQDATAMGLDYLSSKSEPFFLMIEGSYIDWGGHAEDADLMIQEVLDFDKTIGLVLEYIEQHPNTLLIVTADHETGGASVGKKYTTDRITGEVIEDPTQVAVYFNSDQHSGELIPVFAKGKGEENFVGIYENNEIYHKIMESLNF